MKFQIKFRYFGRWHSPSKKQKKILDARITISGIKSELWDILVQGKPIAMRESVLGAEYWLRVAKW
ncbi:hypothetical protein A2442_03610 [Candidatus Campbellbacteria bacterium RIFOXYC2_FULL_35_25]|uniref:Uncharacterized protein n=1 Tax=Candidatus Campbellbacteria bacterium RIFOXYC2_FULL_35_25 TaxID=1797582 RepID=A0A1F5EJP9_9BACT|nr:MAG: hypothetical protein A2442_03610 [Candidatus Campbellbacteria bacterium RIFOXYC2_FULL_35_25]